jgi:dTDP-4-dehydrorhamnose reductase
VTTARVLVLGGTGMLGHAVWRTFRERFDTFVTLRSRLREYEPLGLFDADRAIEGVDGYSVESIARAFERARPSVVVNCIGLVKQLAEANDAVASVTINALLPHRVAELCRRTGARLIQISTDCVFSGTAGGYRESDPADADDLYGRTKRLGEVTDGTALTIRTSIIGRELRSTTGLVEWMLSRRGGRIDGFTQAIFSGMTTMTLARALSDVVEHHASLSGLYHVASQRISKRDLLVRLDEAFGTGITIVPSDRVRIDRSLDGSRFAAATGLAIPDWPAMIRELAADAARYETWRTASVS